MYPPCPWVSLTTFQWSKWPVPGEILFVLIARQGFQPLQSDVLSLLMLTFCLERKGSNLIFKKSHGLVNKNDIDEQRNKAIFSLISFNGLC